MTSSASKVFVKVDSVTEQQETLKNSRKSFKVLQKSIDKENLVGRSSKKGIFFKSKSENEISDSDSAKRKKCCVGCQTNTELQSLSQITEEDLTSTEEPSEGYWKTLAEQRRVALDISLKENEELHERVHNLEEELNISRAMLEETQNLVEVLSELVQEKDESVNSTKDGESSLNSLLNGSFAGDNVEPKNEIKGSESGSSN
ncbi:Geminin [Pseudolycoriella hygida]|uniref:Geminin n=1 Tax=Pseudolycoriella hygida TaxID=35572 RepID=A0A9Q0MV65_9DIPT|nr:Geminin [Pseudolycoriella hygida]